MEKEIEKELLEYFFSEEFQSIVNQIDALLGIDPNNPDDYDKDGSIFYFLVNWFKNRLEGENAKIFAKEVLNFLSEEEINKLFDFINQNLLSKREEVLQKIQQIVFERKSEEKEFEEEVKEESFEEKERKYIEIMQEILNLKKASDKNKPEQKEVDERIKTFKKFSSEDTNDFLDLSKLE